MYFGATQEDVFLPGTYTPAKASTPSSGNALTGFWQLLSPQSMANTLAVYNAQRVANFNLKAAKAGTRMIDATDLLAPGAKTALYVGGAAVVGLILLSMSRKRR